MLAAVRPSRHGTPRSRRSAWVSRACGTSCAEVEKDNLAKFDKEMRDKWLKQEAAEKKLAHITVGCTVIDGLGRERLVLEMVGNELRLGREAGAVGCWVKIDDIQVGKT